MSQFFRDGHQSKQDRCRYAMLVAKYPERHQKVHYEPQIRCFWAELAGEEKLHAKILRDIQKAISSEHLCELPNNHLFQDIQMATIFLDKCHPETVRTLDDAYEIAHEIEFSEINPIFKLLACSFIQKETRKKTLIAQLSNHQNKLSKFTNTFGDKNFRKEIIAKHP